MQGVKSARAGGVIGAKLCTCNLWRLPESREDFVERGFVFNARGAIATLPADVHEAIGDLTEGGREWREQVGT